MNIDVATWGRLMKRSVPNYSDTAEQQTQPSQTVPTGKKWSDGWQLLNISHQVP